ncbi:MAG: DUF5689 domain-containing protein [Candidatus Cryptobacteroides sp.]
MKLRNLFLCAFAAAVTLVGCNKENGEEQTGSLDITLSTETLEFDAAKSSKTVEVTAGREWKATYDVPEGGAWFSVSPESAKGNQTVEIGVSENTGYDRSAEIKFSNGLKSKTLKISQKGTSAFTTIAEVRAMYQGSIVNVADGIKVKGVVISNKDLNNLTSTKSLYVQDATAGINFFCSAAHSFAFGDEVVFDLSGAELTSYNGLVEINGYDASKAEKVGTSTPEAKTVAFEDFMDDKYQGQYVAIENCQVADKDLENKWYSSTAHTSITIDSKSGQSFVVYTSKYATTLDETVPQGSGTIKGIASINGSTLQLILTSKSDYAGLTGERFEGPDAAELSIAKVFETPLSTSVKVKGSVVAVATKSIVINDGGDKNLYVYINAAHTWKVGDAVTVEGTVAAYGKSGEGYTQLIQLSGPVITAYDGTVTPKSETAAELTPEQIDAPYTNASSPKVKVNAMVVVNGNYKNLEFGGSVQGTYVASSFDGEFTEGRVLEITGYYTGVNTAGYISILPVEVKESSVPFFGVPDQSLSVAASATSATFKVTGNVAWTASSSNANFKVEPASGNGAAEVTVTFPANTNTENEVTASITVSTTANVPTKSYTVTITQAKALASDAKVYTRVTDASTLAAGDILLLVCETKNTVAGAMGTYAYLTSKTITITDGIIDPNDVESAGAIQITLGGEKGAWTLTTSEGTIGTTAARKMALNSGTTTWTIDITDGVTKITSTETTYGWIQFNASSPRFLNYSSAQTAIQIYRLGK